MVVLAPLEWFVKLLRSRHPFKAWHIMEKAFVLLYILRFLFVFGTHEYAMLRSSWHIPTRGKLCNERSPSGLICASWLLLRNRCLFHVCLNRMLIVFPLSKYHHIGNLGMSRTTETQCCHGHNPIVCSQDKRPLHISYPMFNFLLKLNKASDIMHISSWSKSIDL